LGLGTLVGCSTLGESNFITIGSGEVALGVLVFFISIFISAFFFKYGKYYDRKKLEKAHSADLIKFTEELKLCRKAASEFKSKYNLPTGYSDHSGTTTACLAAASLGAEILEFHVTFDKRMFGPDASSSLTIDDVKQLVKGVRQIETALSNPMTKEIDEGKKVVKTMFGKYWYRSGINESMKTDRTKQEISLKKKKTRIYNLLPGLIGNRLTEFINNNPNMTNEEICNRIINTQF
jgi:hypothetical protein